MYENGTYRPRYANRTAADRLRHYLRNRSTETWAFFAAGFVLAAILT
ncbi:MAG TPA: hypothetical protein VEY95_16525 [Azospirillaceae bacterium]|nr:hypothetical protein [Azospirillaceae bacterium]